MLKLPVHSTHLSWLFRFGLLVNLAMISWLAFTSSRVEVTSLAGDKANHFAAFFVLSWFIDRGFPSRSFFAFKFLPLFAYGLFIELIQSQLSYRDFSLWDLCTDALAVGAYWLVRNPMRQFVVASIRS